MRFKKVVTEGLVASDSTTSIAAPRGITEVLKVLSDYVVINLKCY